MPSLNLQLVEASVGLFRRVSHRFDRHARQAYVCFFNENVVSEYTHEQAVADGVNVSYEVYLIDTAITQQVARIAVNEYVDRRDRLTRRKRWEQLDEEVVYGAMQLDRDVVNPSQIRNVVRAFRDKLPEIFSGRREVPKTLIFAKKRQPCR
jgi:type I restriction enzyme R subunit